jgi:phosphopantothenoylcysteine synthetase/decarboxylase
VETNEEMLAAAAPACQAPRTAGIFAAAVLDYVPREKLSGKIKSSRPSLRVDLTPTAKIISACQPSSGIKVGFKLEVASPGEDHLALGEALARTYFEREQLSFFVLNFWQDITSASHKALFFARDADGKVQQVGAGHKKADIAVAIAEHIEHLFRLGG